MEVAITKISRNGQVVIPVEIRKDAGVKPSTKFIIFNEGDLIFLRPLSKEVLLKRLDLSRRLGRSEREIRRGKAVRADTRMSDEEIDDLLMG